MSAKGLTGEQVAAWRFERQGLLRRKGKEDWLDAVRKIGGVHAQVMSAAELAIGARADDIQPEHIQRALWEEKSLAKTWAMRGTLHLLPSDAMPGMLSGLRESMSAFYRRPSWLAHHGVTQEQMDAISDGLRSRLGSEPLTREQLAEEIVAHTGHESLRELLLSGWGALLKPAAHEGLLCFGPSQGQNVTFVRPESWLPKWREPAESTEALLREAGRHYLSVFGPALYEDFGRWWGIDPSKAKKVFRSLEGDIVSVPVDGREAWALRSTVEDIRAASIPDNTVRLLPHFDPYTVSLSHRSDYVLAEQHKPLVYRNQGWIYPVVLVNGRMAGNWELEKNRNQIELKVEWFDSSSKMKPAVRAGLEDEAARLAAFYDTDIIMRG
jgi:hypothetical protein